MNKKASEQAWDHPDPLIFDLRCMDSFEITSILNSLRGFKNKTNWYYLTLGRKIFLFPD